MPLTETRYIRLIRVQNIVGRSADDMQRLVANALRSARESAHGLACRRMTANLAAIGETGFDRTHHIIELFRLDAASARRIAGLAGINIETDPRCGIRLCNALHDYITYSGRDPLIRGQAYYTQWVNRLVQNARPSRVGDVIEYIKGELASANAVAARTGRIPESFLREIGVISGPMASPLVPAAAIGAVETGKILGSSEDGMLDDNL